MAAVIELADGLELPVEAERRNRNSEEVVKRCSHN